MFRAYLNKPSDGLSGRLHDLCFDACALSSLAESNPESIRIPVFCESSMSLECLLVIDNLSRIEVDDTERVQWFDMNRAIIAEDFS